MAMTVCAEKGAKRRLRPDMNVTPLIDVVLVLLIIFMAMTPLLNRQFWVHIPEQRKEEVDKQELENDPAPPLVLRLEADGRIAVNGANVTLEELPLRLRRMFAARDDHILFFDAADDLPVAMALAAMDRARDGGAVTIAALTRPLGGTPGEPMPSEATSAPDAVSSPVLATAP
jgi:biopolymer transport protein ExbD/biopolymer transport protein TolR